MTPTSSSATTDARTRTLARVVAIVAGGFLLLSGIWAMAAPASFYETAAMFPPYNQHFLCDIGAFQIGLGAVLLLGVLAPRQGLAVALLGVGIGSATHTLSYVVGRNLGGRPTTDIPTFALLTVLLLAAGWQQWTDQRR